MTWEGWCVFSRGRLGLRKPDSAECVKVGQMESQEKRTFEMPVELCQVQCLPNWFGHRTPFPSLWITMKFYDSILVRDKVVQYRSFPEESFVAINI